jgi:hypothetical protein
MRWRVSCVAPATDSKQERAMHWIKVTNPQYEQSIRYAGQVGEVVGHWGPDNSATSREGFLVEFADGEIVGISEEETEAVDEPGPSKH